MKVEAHIQQACKPLPPPKKQHQHNFRSSPRPIGQRTALHERSCMEPLQPSDHGTLHRPEWCLDVANTRRGRRRNCTGTWCDYSLQPPPPATNSTAYCTLDVLHGYHITDITLRVFYLNFFFFLMHKSQINCSETKAADLYTNLGTNQPGLLELLFLSQFTSQISLSAGFRTGNRILSITEACYCIKKDLLGWGGKQGGRKQKRNQKEKRHRHLKKSSIILIHWKSKQTAQNWTDTNPVCLWHLLLFHYCCTKKSED